MIYSLRGKLALIGENFLVIECNGVGYKCMCSLRTIELFKSKLSNEIYVYTYLNIYQDGMELFCFSDSKELECFKLLISVSGIGPKVSLGILSCFGTLELAKIISDSDSKSLTMAQGIGLKTAKRVILELKDKFSKSIVLEDSSINTDDFSQKSNTNKKSQALNALMTLGYSKFEISPILSGLSEDLKVEQMISYCLKQLGKGG